jgi:hypothetical protein
MVLKVVTGKILETLELRPLSVACGSVLELQAGMALTDPAWTAEEDASAIRLSKIWYYLVDNIYNFILSRVMDRVQEESGGMAERFPNWDEGGAGKRVGDKYVFFRLSKTPPKRSLDGAPSGVK